MEFFDFRARELHADAPTEGDEPARGRFSAVVSTYGTVVPGFFYDRKLEQGCFQDSIAAGWPSCVWSHDWDAGAIGATLAISEPDEGLTVETELFTLADDENPLARRVYANLTARNGDGRSAVNEFSIGFDIEDVRWEIVDPEADEPEELMVVTKARLYEYGPCLVGRNASRLVSVDARKAAANEQERLAERFHKPTDFTNPKRRGRPAPEADAAGSGAPAPVASRRWAELLTARSAH